MELNLKLNIQLKRTALLLIDAKAMIFGVGVFNLILVLLHSPVWQFHRNIFFAVLLLASSLLLLLNKSWSNLIAAVLGGYLPVAILSGFWMLAYDAEVPVFSYRHFSYFFRGMAMERGGLLFIALTLGILARAVFAVMRSIAGRINPE